MQGDWLYFNQNRKLYKMRTDGSELTKLSDDYAYNLNVSGGWIYYCHYSGNKNLIRIRTDGTQREELTSGKSLDIHVLGPYVFYNDMSKMNKLELPELVNLRKLLAGNPAGNEQPKSGLSGQSRCSFVRNFTQRAAPIA